MEHRKDCELLTVETYGLCTCDFDKRMKNEAEARVLAVRGSYDAPGFEACVEAEIAEMTRRK